MHKNGEKNIEHRQKMFDIGCYRIGKNIEMGEKNIIPMRSNVVIVEPCNRNMNG